MTDQPHDELDWQAFRYIAAEMTSDEVAQFEEQLAEDQPSREAVARAVELAEAVAIVAADRAPDTGLGKTGPHRQVRSAWWSRVSWFGVGAAAALACVFLLRVIGGEPEQKLAADKSTRTPTELRAPDDAKAAQLAEAWCRTRDEIEQAAGDAWPPSLVDAPYNEPEGATAAGAEDATLMQDTAGDGLSGDQIDSVETVPSWMLAAVAGEMERMDDGLPQPEER